MLHRCRKSVLQPNPYDPTLCVMGAKDVAESEREPVCEPRDVMLVPVDSLVIDRVPCDDCLMGACDCAWDQVPLKGPNPDCEKCHGSGDCPSCGGVGDKWPDDAIEALAQRVYERQSPAAYETPWTEAHSHRDSYRKVAVALLDALRAAKTGDTE